eukprot:1156838-Pelagomonas_calceolata.AAC.2
MGRLEVEEQIKKEIIHLSNWKEKSDPNLNGAPDISKILFNNNSSDKEAELIKLPAGKSCSLFNSAALVIAALRLVARMQGMLMQGLLISGKHFVLFNNRSGSHLLSDGPAASMLSCFNLRRTASNEFYQNTSIIMLSDGPIQAFDVAGCLA